MDLIERLITEFKSIKAFNIEKNKEFEGYNIDLYAEKRIALNKIRIFVKKHKGCFSQNDFLGGGKKDYTNFFKTIRRDSKTPLLSEYFYVIIIITDELSDELKEKKMREENQNYLGKLKETIDIVDLVWGGGSIAPGSLLIIDKKTNKVYGKTPIAPLVLTKITDDLRDIIKKVI